VKQALSSCVLVHYPLNKDKKKIKNVVLQTDFYPIMCKGIVDNMGGKPMLYTQKKISGNLIEYVNLKSNVKHTNRIQLINLLQPNPYSNVEVKISMIVDKIEDTRDEVDSSVGSS